LTTADSDIFKKVWAGIKILDMNLDVAMDVDEKFKLGVLEAGSQKPPTENT
jgi:hypothetical protein